MLPIKKRVYHSSFQVANGTAKEARTVKQLKKHGKEDFYWLAVIAFPSVCLQRSALDHLQRKVILVKLMFPKFVQDVTDIYIIEDLERILMR